MKMLEISVFILILQIGFNAALNYLGYNYSPLNPTPRLINYGQSRRLLEPNHYLELPSRRDLGSESDQSDSEDSSLEETSYRGLHTLLSQPYLRRNDYMRYDTRSDNDISLESAPVGRMGPDNYADVYQSALSVSNQADTNFRRPYLRRDPSNVREVQNQKYRRIEDNDLTLEVSSVDRNSPADYTQENLVATRAGKPQDANYLRSLLSLIELPNLRRNQHRKYHRKGDNDLSLEVSPLDRLNSDYEDITSLTASRAVGLDDTNLLESVLYSNLETPDYRRGSISLEQSLTDKPSLEDDNTNSNSLRSSQLHYKLDNNRRHKKSKKMRNNLRLEIPSPDKDTPDAYMDTVFVVTGEGKPDDIAFARPQLRSPEVKNERYNRRNYDSLGFELSSNDRISPDDDSTNNLSAFRGLKTSRKRSKLRNNNPNQNQKFNENVGLESLSNDRFIPEESDVNNLSGLRRGSLEQPQQRSYDQKQRNNRRDDNGVNLGLSSNDRLSLDDDVAINISELLLESLRSSEPSYQDNGRRENDDTRLELPLNDDAEEDTVENVLVLSSVSLEDLLRSHKPSYRSRNENQRSNRRDDTNILELIFNDKLTADNQNKIDELIPYHEYNLKSSEPLNNTRYEKENYIKKDNDDVNLELSSNVRENLNDNVANDVSLLRSTRLDPELDAGLLSGTSLDGSSLELLLRSLTENQSNQQDSDTLHLEFPWNDHLSPDSASSSDLSPQHGHKSRLRNREHYNRQNKNNNNNIDNYELHLEYPWNDVLSPDEDVTTSSPPVYRSENLDDMSYERPYLRLKSKKRNHNRRAYSSNNPSPRGRLFSSNLYNEDASVLGNLENSRLSSRPYMRNLDRSINENQSVRAHPVSQAGEENTSEILEDSFEDLSSYITFPLDRRPYARHRSRDNDENRPLNINRRSNTPLVTTTASPNTTADASLNAVEDATESDTYNDTVIIPAH